MSAPILPAAIMVIAAAMDEPRDIGQLQVGMVKIGEADRPLWIKRDRCGAAVHDVDHAAIGLGIRREGIRRSVRFHLQ